MYLEYYLYYLYYLFLGAPFVLRVAVAFISILVPFLTVVFFFLIYKRRIFYKKKKLTEEIKEKYGSVMIEIVTATEVYDVLRINEALNCKPKKFNKRKKRAFTNVILAIRDANEEKINEKNWQHLISYLGTDAFFEKQLVHGGVKRKSRALRKLDDLHSEITGSTISSLTYHRNPYLRKKARSYYLYYNKNSPYKFFDEDFDKTLNEWDKIEIHRMLAGKKNDRMPNLVQWIKNSKNNDFKCFLIDEIKYFDQKENAPYLLKLARTNDMELRKHCIDALGDIGYQQAEDVLVLDYFTQPLLIQQSVVRTIGKLYTGRALHFLRKAFEQAHDSESRLLILSVIYNYGEMGKGLFDSLRKDASGFTLKMFDHVSNPLIKMI